MKQHPILFSTPMVQAILEGRKTQTRRIMKRRDGSHVEDEDLSWHYPEGEPKFIDTVMDFSKDFPYWRELKCPYGQVGDVLWVRENFRVRAWVPDDCDLYFRYEADGAISDAVNFDYEHDDGETFNRYWIQSCDDLAAAGYEIDEEENYKDYKFDALRLRPSIHMPYDVCRLFLEITGIRVERLQDISEEDAKTEGIFYDTYHPGYRFDGGMLNATAKEAFSELWQSINGPESWGVSPWVWVVEFKKIDKP